MMKRSTLACLTLLTLAALLAIPAMAATNSNLPIPKVDQSVVMLDADEPQITASTATKIGEPIEVKKIEATGTVPQGMTAANTKGEQQTLTGTANLNDGNQIKATSSTATALDIGADSQVDQPDGPNKLTPGANG